MDRISDPDPERQQENVDGGAEDYLNIPLHENASSLADMASLLREVARQLGEFADGQHPPKYDQARRAVAGGSNNTSPLSLARHAYWLRRQRAHIFGGADLFGEPAWDILLDLFIAHYEGKPVSVSSACIGSASPPTTGLRWLSVLAQNDLVMREKDPADHRRIMVRLTEKGVSALERFFDLARQIS